MPCPLLVEQPACAGSRYRGRKPVRSAPDSPVRSAACPSRGSPTRRIEQRVKHGFAVEAAACSTRRWRRCDRPARRRRNCRSAPDPAMPRRRGPAPIQPRRCPCETVRAAQRAAAGENRAFRRMAQTLPQQCVRLRARTVMENIVTRFFSLQLRFLVPLVAHPGGSRLCRRAADGPTDLALVRARPEHSRQAGHHHLVRFDRRGARGGQAAAAPGLVRARGAGRTAVRDRPVHARSFAVAAHVRASR